CDPDEPVHERGPRRLAHTLSQGRFGCKSLSANRGDLDALQRRQAGVPAAERVSLHAIDFGSRLRRRPPLDPPSKWPGERPPPPEEHDDRQRGQDLDDAPAVEPGNDEVSEQGCEHEAEREEAGERADEAPAVLLLNEFREEGSDDSALGADAEAGDDAT